MKQLVFATHNQNKVAEIKDKLSQQFEILSLKDIGFDQPIPEDFETLRENAAQKAHTVKEQTGLDCFADDTGLLVEALNGAPGVYSARYAGPECNSTRNIEKLLRELSGIANRKAYFETCICLILNGNTHFFSGQAHGVITKNAHGKEGFGYDPVFRPDGFEMTFAEMSMAQKNKISHRALVFEQMLIYLKSA